MRSLYSGQIIRRALSLCKKTTPMIAQPMTLLLPCTVDPTPTFMSLSSLSLSLSLLSLPSLCLILLISFIYLPL